MNELLSLMDLFNKSIFRIPDYQRGYSWGKLQLEEFWSDLVNLLQERDHYTGMISLKKIDRKQLGKEYDKWNDEKWIVDSWGYNVYEIVDGQQRLTTLIILINEIVNYYKNIYKDKKENEIFVNSIPLSNIISEYLVIRKPDSEIIKTYKFGYEVDNPSYEYFKYRILNEDNPGDIKETFYTLNLNNAKEFFKNRIQELVERKGIEELENIFKKITQKLKFNMYYIDDDFNVFIAFETMNNRGKRLSNLELLKNRLIYLTTVFNASDDEKQKVRKSINDVWKDIYGFLGKNKENPLSDDEFLQAHWIMYFGYRRGKTKDKTITYNSFLLNKYFTQQNINSEYTYDINDIENEENIDLDIEEELEEENEVKVSDKNEKLKITDIYNYIESLKNLIKYWYEIHYPTDELSSELRMYIERLNRLGYVYFKPLATVILSKKDLSIEQKILCFKAIERFIFLHFRINNYFSTYKNSFYYNLAHDYYIGNKDLNYVLEQLNTIDFLSDNKVARMNGLFDKFERLFKYDGFYSWANIRYVLYEYERHLSKGTGIVKLMPQDIFKKDEKDHYSIEHIYPQTADNEYWKARFDKYSDEEKKYLTGSLGNLLPLSQSINSTLQNYSFDDKKTREPRGYQNGSHNEIEVSRYLEWTSREILERGLKIVNFLENEYDFIIPSRADRIKFLGLDFMIEDEDYNTDATESIETKSEEKKQQKEFDESEFLKLSENAQEWQLRLFNELDQYSMSLSEKVYKNTTKNYIAWNNDYVFLEFHFKSNYITCYLRPGKYDDEKNKVTQLSDSYNWTNNNRIDITENDDIDYIKNIIYQSFNK